MSELCPICQELLSSPHKNGIYHTNCNHKYHTDCFVSWCSQSKGGCPICRESHIYINNMEHKGRIEFLKYISKNENSNEYIKSLGLKITDMEHKLKEYEICLADFIKDNNEYHRTYNKYTKRINKTKQDINDLEYKLLGIPLLELPPHLLVKTQLT